MSLSLIPLTQSNQFTTIENRNTWYLQTSWDTSGLFDVFFSSNTHGWTVGVGTILHTNDSGNIWSEQNSPVAGNFYSVYFVDDTTGWVAGSGGNILHTTDGGNTWVEQNSGYSGSYSFNLFFHNATHGWAAGGKPQTFPSGANRVILKTTDGGSTWNTNLFESDTFPFKSIYFTDSDNGWAVGDYNYLGYQILYTDDGGATWTGQNSTVTNHLEDVYFTDVNNGWAVGNQATLITTNDGGNTWNYVDPGINHSLTSIHFTDSQNGWITTGNNTDAFILRTDNGGTTWTAVEPGTDNFLSGIHLIDPYHGWAVGFDGDIVHKIGDSSLVPIEDVNQSIQDRGFPIRHAADGDWAGAQDFLPSTGSITKVAIYVRKFGTPEFDLTVELREGGVTGTLLDTVIFTPAQISPTWEYLDIDFIDMAVNPTTQYFIVCPPAPSNVNTSFGYEWGYAFGDVYADGSFWFTRDGGNLWRDLPTRYDFTFKTYGI